MSEKQQEEVKGELVNVPQSGGAMVDPLAQFTGNQARPMFTTMDLAKPENRMELLDVMLDNSNNAEKFINHEFTIKDVVIYLKEYMPNKETGEQIQAVWSTVITTDGDRINFHSQGILDHLQAICQMAAKSPLSKLGKFKLVQVPMKSSHRMFQLQRVRKEADKAAK